MCPGCSSWVILWTIKIRNLDLVTLTLAIQHTFIQVVLKFSLSAVTASVSGSLSLHLCAPYICVFVSNIISVSVCLSTRPYACLYVCQSVCMYVALSPPLSLSLSVLSFSLSCHSTLRLAVYMWTSVLSLLLIV